MKRWLLAGLLTGALFLAVRERFVLEDDPVRSLRSRDPKAAKLFDAYQERSLFKEKIFVDFSKLSEKEAADLEGVLKQARYTPTTIFPRPAPEALAPLLPLLPVEALQAHLSDEALEKRAQEALSFAMLPGGSGYLAQLEKDPLGLGTLLFTHFATSLLAGDNGAEAPADLRVYQSPSPLKYDEVEVAYNALLALGDKVHFIGGDFYSYENYKAVYRDVFVCSTLSLILNLALFFIFTRRWTPLALLFVGSIISYLAGLLAVGLVYERIFSLALAFTSTFVGFNNEYLVHLSGIEEGERKQHSILAIWSAIGTTLLGFLVLLLGHSVIIRQMSLASLGGMVGFLGFLFLFKKPLGEIRFRTFDWPKATVGRRGLALLGAASLLLLFVLPRPTISTSIEDFRFQSPALEAQAKYFTEKLGQLSLDRVYAAPISGTPHQTFQALESAGVLSAHGHPLRWFRSTAEQQKSIDFLKERLGAASAKMQSSLEEAGLALAPAAISLPATLDEWGFLTTLNALSPAKWAQDLDGERFLFVPAKADAPVERSPVALLPMSPQFYFDTLLTDLSRELGWLFLLGMAAMTVYLAWLQKSFFKVLYVFLPLALSAAAFLVIVRTTGVGLNIIHFVAFALVIGLATDYTSVAVSTDHHDVEMSKILLTSLSTLATFGILLVARHPVLKDLGVTVTAGCVITALLALFVKPVLPAKDKP